MGMFRYSEAEARSLVGNVVKALWPSEDLLLVTTCSAEPIDPADPRLAEAVSSRSRISPHGVEGWEERGFLAVTRSRLIFQERTAHGAALRSIGVLLAILAVALLFFGDSLITAVVVGSVAGALWGIGRLSEVIATGDSEVEFAQVHLVDLFGQRIEGFGRSGALCRLRIHDREDFETIAWLVRDAGSSAA